MAYSHRTLSAVISHNGILRHVGRAATFPCWRFWRRRVGAADNAKRGFDDIASAMVHMMQSEDFAAGMASLAALAFDVLVASNGALPNRRAQKYVATFFKRFKTVFGAISTARGRADAHAMVVSAYTVAA